MWKNHTHIQDNQLKPPIVAKNPCRHHADGVFEFLGSFYLIIHDEFIKKVLYLSIENTIIFMNENKIEFDVDDDIVIVAW